MKEPPHNDFAERAVIGAIILDQRKFSTVSRILKASDFYAPKNRAIFDAIYRLDFVGDAIDVISIHARMTATGTLKEVGSIAYFGELTDDCLPSLAEQYARIVRELSIRRGLIEAGQCLIKDGYNTRIEHCDLIGRARSTVISACEPIHASTAVQVSDAIESAITAAQSDVAPPGVVYTGIPSIDAFGGLFPGCLTILGARPSMGKSMLALNIASNAALAGKKVLYVSLEDVAIFLHFRLLARFANVDSGKIRDRTLNFDEKMRIGVAKDVIGCLPLWIDDSGGKTAADIRSSVLAHKDREGCELVVIDHLAHVSRKGKEYDALTEAVSSLGEIPKEIDAPVLLLSQLNRDIEKRSERAPQLSDLRGTGEIEQRARMVWFIDCPGVYKKEQNPTELNFSCAKNTHGKVGNAKLRVDFSKMHVSEWKGDGVQPWSPPGRKNAEY